MAKKKKIKSKRTTSKPGTRKRTGKSARGKKSQGSAKTVKKRKSPGKSASKITPARRQKALRASAQRLPSSWAREGAASDQQSGDLEGLSRVEQADSESVDELVEEGNVFEAGAVAGVEAADDEDTKEVRTHEVPEDDVPDEYLDKD
jgi:hypothetical protein